MGSIIRATGTVLNSLLYSNSRQDFNGLKHVYSVISVIVIELPGNTQNRESTRSWMARVRLFHPWTDEVNPLFFKGGPEPHEKERHEFLGSNLMINFPTLFVKWYQKHVKVRFSYLVWHDNFCKGPRTLRKFLQKC